MLAKVVKRGSADHIAPFSLTEIGTGAQRRDEPAGLVVPEVARPAAQPAAAAARAAHAYETVAEAVDAGAAAEEIISTARAEAARIVAEADRSAEAIAEGAREKAVREMELRFDEEVAAKTDELRAELTRTIDRVAGLTKELTARHEHDIVELALQIAKKIVAREVTLDREIAFTLVKVSLGKLHNRAVAEVHLNPEDLTYVEAHREKLDFRGALDLVSDRSISVGGCLIHTDTGDIDARVESQFDEIAHGLLV